MEKGNKTDRVAILLATYNGGRYLEEQLLSLYSQTYKEWTLYVHDDGSIDNTLEIVKNYQQRYSNIIVLDYPPVGGAKNNFLSMVQKVDADYYFFCDQDDVWLNRKIELSLDAVKSAEAYEPDIPVTAFSDLYVVDSKLNVISDSFFKYEGIYPQFLLTLNELGACNLCPGCSMAFNRKARDVVVFPADEATMHDTWVVLCTAKYGGRLKWIDKPLVKYRQHKDNVLGAQDIKGLTIAFRIKHLSEILSANMQTYRMLRSLGYGSMIKYVFYKILYKMRVRKDNKKR